MNSRITPKDSPPQLLDSSAENPFYGPQWLYFDYSMVLCSCTILYDGVKVCGVVVMSWIKI